MLRQQSRNSLGRLPIGIRLKAKHDGEPTVVAADALIEHLVR
jgi:hypothetical protein